MPGRPRGVGSANGRGRVRRATVRPGPPQDSNRTSVWEPAAGRAARGPISGGGSRPPNVGPGGPAPRCCLRRRRGRASRTTTFAGRRQRRRSCEREPGAAAQRHVGEHGRAAAPGHDQPVRAGRGLRGRPGAAAAAGGALAIRDCPEHVLPREQHSQQPPPPADGKCPSGPRTGPPGAAGRCQGAGDSHVAGERRAANVNKEPKCLPGKSAPRPALARPTLGPASSLLDRGLRPCAGCCALGLGARVEGR